jgi:O-antigen/teichoic acid export membrane protein
MTNISKNSFAVSKTVFVSIIVVIFVVCIAAGMVAYQLKPTATPTPTPSPTPSIMPSPTPSPTPIPTYDPHVAPIERIVLQAVSYDNLNNVLTVYAQSQGDVSPVIKSIIVKDQFENTVAPLSIGVISPATTGNALAKGTLYTIPSTVYSTGLATGTYTATLVTNAGGSFVSPSFTVTNNPQSYSQ